MSNGYPTPWPKDPPPVSSDVVIMTRKELETYAAQCFKRGVERGRLEERMDINSTARGSEGHLGATENTGSAPSGAAVRPANFTPSPFPSLCDSGGELWDADEAS